MDTSLKAVYENGVFRPLEPVSLPERNYSVLQIAKLLKKASTPQS